MDEERRELREERRRKLAVPMWQAQLYSFLIPLPAVLVLVALYLGLWGFSAGSELTPGGLLVFYVVGGLVFVVGVVAHEALHGLTWMLLGGKSRAAISYGVQWRSLTPYAHCREPMSARAYRWGAAMPGLVLGVPPSLAGVATGNGWVMLFGALFTLAAGGDALILWLLRGVEPGTPVEDHPTEAGCYVLDG